MFLLCHFIQLSNILLLTVSYILVTIIQCEKNLLQDLFYIIYFFYKQNRKIQTVEFERVKCLRLTDFSRLESFSLQWKDKKRVSH